MQRLVLAVLILAGLIALLAVVMAGLRAVLAPKEPADGIKGDDMLQKVAFFLLLALIAYVATTGAP
ncbi:MAG: hypothetical protein HKO95_11480 [Rhodobacteraceae bacterium]|jgi:hypothetical protein|nr:hypothetical protein [Alphaproteobacteria bacterium]MBT8474775.1 hypothetical protein [Alphaproteobacteria bacterium]NNF73418.1 hypothetical protein [Paracoccaceae bacterium]NNK67345.1 hypothetical protein [Paracoccaceae bacterium]